LRIFVPPGCRQNIAKHGLRNCELAGKTGFFLYEPERTNPIEVQIRQICTQAPRELPMTSFFSKIAGLFSGGAKDEAVAQAKVESHADCKIFAMPMREGNQYRLAGRIEKEVDGAILVRTFIRADVYASLDDALEGTFRKARQIIDQNGPSLFSDGAPTRNA
jgi:hypothetical protein